ncbi:general stress protein [Bacillus sp. FJAT-27225]|uniref:pyridoxamine 5'-phosphate oxidase family protein n=1 Tax=Bacillus sp. FJAT-27225 TaxID=1743144 RepID=UPI00080C3262|nr:pyridoxamine 5'-phosphate oxidase family protein [Bacillus sp. FJAT-27225]OCA90617.1 general stress protein [Bacillus sp. FJAT-27225]
MSNSLRDKILSILEKEKTGTLATVRNGKPYSRYMDFYNEGLILYSASDLNTHKVGDMERNPYVHILLGYHGQGLKDSFLEVEGKATILDSAEEKQRLWNPDFEGWFEGPNDPAYIVLKITPEQIRLMNTKNGKPEVYQVGSSDLN